MGAFFLVILPLQAAEPALTRTRSIPQPLPIHPGNVFLDGEVVRVPLPPGESSFWHAFDYEGNVVSEGRGDGGLVELGRLPVGYYEIRRVGAGPSVTHRESIAVLAPLAAPTPLASPVGIDVAMAWFYPQDRMPAVANLCALAGVNWVRDRLSWPELEPERGRFAEATRYDASARAQSAAGLAILQVNHLSPSWANPETKRFPLDLRDIYRAYRELAGRWRGQVVAFEPWNEADIPMFGGHIGSEIASLQKAAYLGLKAGHADLTVCQNVFALHNREILEDFAENQAWPYFDTFDLHHYVAFDQWPAVYADFRSVSAGKPLWVTECSVPVKWTGDPALKEPSEAELRVQAERVAKIFAASLFEGTQEIFYFLLPHYAEGQTQFGLLRPDLTPRPAFVALAAVGRLLADARPVGRLRSTNAAVRGFVFRVGAGQPRHDLLVAWTTGPSALMPLPANPLERFDYLGRKRAPGGALLELGIGPVFVSLPLGSARKMFLAPSPPAPRPLPGRLSTVVLQAVWPAKETDLEKSAYRLVAAKVATIPIHVYNFGDKPARGKLWVKSPAGWSLTFPKRVELEPGERKELSLTVDASAKESPAPETVLVTGNFGWAGKPLLSLRLESLLSPGQVLHRQ